MALPEQLNVTKDNKYCIENVNAIINMSTMSMASKRNDILSWKMFHEEYNESDYDYLRKVGDYEYPARVRWVGIVRPPLNFLLSQKERKPFSFGCFAIDKRSLKKRQENQIKKYLDVINKKVKDKFYTIRMQLQQVEQQKAKIEQMMQQQPENEEQMQQLEQLRQIYPQIEKQIELVKEELKRESVINKKDIQEVEKYNRYDLRDVKEELSQHGIKKLRQRLDIKNESLRAFTEKLVTDKPSYFVDYKPGDKLPEFRNLDSVKVYYPTDNSSRWIQDGQWVAIEEMMSPSQIIDMYGEEFSGSEMKMIQDYKGATDNTTISATNGGGAVFNDNIYSGSQTTGQTIRVWRCYWMTPRKIKAKMSPNKYKAGTYFTHFVDSQDLEKYPVKKDKGEKLETRYVNDVYQGVMIQTSEPIYKNLGKKPTQLRNVDNYSKVELPVIGRTFNNISEKPYSLIWATKDIQIMYNLVNYHEELLIALAGVKGFVMDKSQMPDDMSPEEWMYQRKLGTGYIQTVKKGQRERSSFNQFTSYDDTISPAIQWLEMIKEGYINTVHSITGVSRPSMGEIVPTDQVKTFEASREQSSLITEIMFHKADEVEGKALTRLINICNKILWKDGELLSYTNPDLSPMLVNIPPKIMMDSEIEVLVADNSKEEQGMRDIKQMAFNEYGKGLFNLSQYVKLYNIDSLKELEKTLDYFIEKAEERMQENATQTAEGERQFELEKIKMQQQYDQVVSGQENAIKEYATKIDEARLQFDKDKEAWLRDYKDRELETKKQLETLKILSEREVEGTYLQEDIRASKVDEALRAMQLKIDAIINATQINSNEKTAMKKISMDDKDKKGQPKERIVD